MPLAAVQPFDNLQSRRNGLTECLTLVVGLWRCSPCKDRTHHASVHHAYAFCCVYFISTSFRSFCWSHCVRHVFKSSPLFPARVFSLTSLILRTRLLLLSQVTSRGCLAQAMLVTSSSSFAITLALGVVVALVLGAVYKKRRLALGKHGMPLPPGPPPGWFWGSNMPTTQ